ncbi:13152_t:CDS:2 [Ambispora gerdemannii]|uniref:13152_t:CDS:1 n=1 Tax=Ambispora gerdemannii TaxID=144530 RepID=A0A9N9CK56_9GLOM|nr:13152_t:CDS:2 [Ambispora gerdemannii]
MLSHSDNSEDEFINESDDETKYDGENDVYDPVEDLDKEKLLIRTPLQEKCFNFFARPVSIWAKMFWGLSSVCVLATITMICIDSIPTIHYDSKFIYLEFGIIFIFTIEYVGRFYASVHRLAFIRKFLNAVDLLSIILFYLDLFFNLTEGVTIQVFKKSASQIAMLFMWIGIVILMSSSIMYYLERGEFDEQTRTWYKTLEDGTQTPSSYQSIVDTIIVTINDYGGNADTPITPWGKLLASLMALWAIMTIAIPTSILEWNFVTVWDAYRHKKMLKSLQTLDQTEPAKQNSPRKKLRALQGQNEALVQLLAELQDQLNELNPPNFRKKCREFSDENQRLRSQMHDLASLTNMCKNKGNRTDSY